MAKGEGASLRSMLVNSSRTLVLRSYRLKRLTDHPSILEEPRLLVESEVAASDQCLPRELNNAEAVYRDFHTVVAINCSGCLTSSGMIESGGMSGVNIIGMSGVKYVEDRVGK